MHHPQKMSRVNKIKVIYCKKRETVKFKLIKFYYILLYVVCLFVFYVPSTARSLRDGTTIYCPLRRT